MYLRTGYGWSNPKAPEMSWSDAQMRAEINLRRKNGSAPSRRSSEAGQGAWGGFRGDGRWEPYEDVGFHAHEQGEERYMTNRRFALVMGVVVRREWNRTDVRLVWGDGYSTIVWKWREILIESCSIVSIWGESESWRADIVPRKPLQKPERKQLCTGKNAGKGFGDACEKQRS